MTEYRLQYKRLTFIIARSQADVRTAKWLLFHHSWLENAVNYPNGVQWQIQRGGHGGNHHREVFQRTLFNEFSELFWNTLNNQTITCTVIIQYSIAFNIDSVVANSRVYILVEYR